MKLIQISGGIVAILIVGLIVAVFIARVMFNRTIHHVQENFNNRIQKNETDVVTKGDLSHLPQPVADWLNEVGVVGVKPAQSVTLTQHGEMKLTVEQDQWIDARASQIIRLDSPGYVWEADIQTPPLVGTRGLDVLDGDKASMTIKVASMVPVANETTSKKLIQSSMHRFLMELPWYPSASINDYISWKAIDEYSAQATLSAHNEQVTATFFFDHSVVKRVEAFRYKETTAEAEPILCTGEFDHYEEKGTYLVPTKAKITWDLPEGPFTWYQFENTDVSYN
ncbi:hypothetical protein HMI01_26670 [Halolactibacillus miurensis]|uniref:Uncharacterized protein n=1 Tax=Halolactibacillus miurensis TaxID=306541 RepID=A0A1I6UCD7_9BACI|nr:DUF6544 family protein [Halolactibacillus miurensis]GEM05679.1 hypothetical protein HMI01_26670 [Halolactibacillus miurensis]SFS99058.1 hypothetical protein SAMN05421668_12443 [Halolactibacillus miurensis]